MRPPAPGKNKKIMPLSSCGFRFRPFSYRNVEHVNGEAECEAASGPREVPMALTPTNIRWNKK
jgi:hypothetical protein